MKKFVAVLIAVTLVSAMFLTACETEGTPAAAPDGDVTQLVLWHIQTHEPRAAVLQDSVDRFMAANPNYVVEVVPIMNDVYKQRLIIAMAANALPDIFVSWSGGPMNEYVNAGHVLDITDMVAATDLPDRLLEGGLAQATFNDRIWGLPAEGVTIATVWYNRDIFDDLGLEVPNTIGELEAVADTLVENDIIPFALANSTMWTGSMYYMNLATRYAGLEPFQRAVSGEGSFEDPSFVFAGERIRDWVERGFFAPGFNGADEDIGASRQLMYAEMAAMHIMGTWFVSQVMAENPDFLSSLGTFNFPAYENSDADPNIVIGTIGDNFYHIASTTVSPEGAFELLTFMVDEISMEQRLAAGAIPPIVGVADMLEEPLVIEVMRIVEAAPAVQLWYDQYLPPEVAQAHLNSSQELFGLTMTPEQANAVKQAAMESYLGR